MPKFFSQYFSIASNLSLGENKKISVSQVQRLTGKTWPASSKLLKGLKTKGILNDIRKAKQRDPSARYILQNSEIPQKPKLIGGKNNKI